jgi:multidrug resistance protein, MATE family
MTTTQLTLRDAARDVSRISWPFALSRLGVSANILGNGFVTPHIGADAVAAGPVMISAAYAIIGPPRSVLLTTGILIGKVHGEIKALEADASNSMKIEQLKQSIGVLLRQSFLLGTLLGAGATAVMLALTPILKTTSIDPGVQKNISDFLNATAIGLLPMFWSTSDQQFAMATDRKYLPMFFGSLFPVLSMILGYPLALGAGSLPKLGTAGLGYGMSAASWISFLSLRAYFLKSEFADYNIYKKEIAGLLEKMSDLCRLGFPMGFQALTEWGNLFAMSQLLVPTGKDSAMAANASFQIISSFAILSSAIGQGISVKIAQQLGMLKTANDDNNTADMAICSDNAKMLGNAGAGVAVTISAVVALVLVAFAEKIQSVFVANDSANYDDVMQLGKIMLITNAVSLILDTTRNMPSSALAGSKDVLFAPTVSMLSMSVAALAVGWHLSVQQNLSPNYLFVTRNIGIVIAAAAIGIRWSRKSHLPPAANTQIASRDNSLCSELCSMFGKKTHAAGPTTPFLSPQGANVV